MKIAVVAYWDWAGSTYELTQALNRFSKHQAFFFRFNNTKFDYPTMYDVNSENMKETKEIIQSCDVLIVSSHLDSLDVLNLNLDKFSKIVFYGVGTVIRNSNFRIQLYEKFRKLKVHNFQFIVSTADLTYFEPNSIFIPECLSVDELRAKIDYSKRMPPLVAMAPSANLWYNGIKEFVEVTDKLWKPQLFQTAIIQGLKNIECLKQKAHASIFFDRFFITYGTNAQEAGAFESAVLTGDDSYVLEKIRETTGVDCPFLLTLEKEDLEKHLKELLNDPEYLQRKQTECYEFVKTVHDGRLTAKLFEEFLE